MRNPVFLSDIKQLGQWYWIEIEGCEKMLLRQSGNFAAAENEILGWGCKTLGEVFEKQKEVNYAPRVRYWEGFAEAPTKAEREDGSWRGDSRCWAPNILRMDEDARDARWAEYLETGRTQWPLQQDPDDPVALNRSLYEAGEEPLAPICSGCHCGKWKRGTDRRWSTLKSQ